MKQFLAKRPWILVVVAFVVLISAWSIFFYIALNNQPEKIPLKHEMAEETVPPAEDSEE